MKKKSLNNMCKYNINFTLRMRKLSFEKIALAILTAASALRRLPLMSISRSELLVARASAITAPPSGPNPFQLKFILFKPTFS
jgi:hypothetical protein